MLDEIYRDMQADSFSSMIPVMSNQPELAIKVIQARDNLLMPWEVGAVEPEKNWDQLYYDNIGKYDEKEKDV